MIKNVSAIMLAIAFIPMTANAKGYASISVGDAERIALKHEPGIIHEVEVKKRELGKVFEFQITKKNGAIVELEIDGRNGVLIEHKLEKLARGEKLKSPKVPENAAMIIAQKYISKRLGDHNASAKGASYTRVNGMNVYDVDVDMSDSNSYEVYVDAMTGNVINAKLDD